MNDNQSLRLLPERAMQGEERSRHRWMNRFSRFGFDQPQSGIWPGHEEVDFQTLLVPEIVQLLP